MARAATAPGAPDEAVCAACHRIDRDGNPLGGFLRDDGPITGDRLRETFHAGYRLA